ncbi:MAG: TIGR03936 family radical SAM-associated protein [Nocardioides sp.]
MSREQPPQQAPPVQRLRIRYAKRGRLRFTSHRDFSRAFERAVFRARLPMAYSSGFNPHPRISYAGASPTGAASEAEYLEIGLREVIDPVVALAALADSLPDGLDVLEIVETPTENRTSLTERLTGSRWRIEASGAGEPAAAAVATFLATDEHPVQRMTKKGLRTFDARAAVIALVVATSDEGRLVLDLVLRHGEPSVRPDDVVRALVEAGAVLDGPLFSRLAQGVLDDSTGEIGDPFA